MTLHGAGQPAYQVVDPATGEPVRSCPYATDTEVAEILDAAQAAYLDTEGRHPKKCVLVTDDKLAVELATSTPYGLGAALFSADPERARVVAEHLETCMVNIDTPSFDGPEPPFGGVRRSGFGRELRPGVSEFMNRRLVCTAVQPHVRSVRHLGAPLRPAVDT
ncbi:aldehyde dehydrogenase family protein [Streptomyces galilaeus]